MLRQVRMLVGVGLLALVARAAASEPLTTAERERLQKQAEELDQESVRLFQARRPEQALPLAQRLLTLREKLYPVTEYPEGHPDLANTVDSMGVILGSMREYPRALPYHQRALAMRERLFAPAPAVDLTATPVCAWVNQRAA
jgi:tetratricopeptide (TPR) repeat protein